MREDLRKRLSNRIGVWKSDLTGLRRMETQAGRQRQWDEAMRFQECAQTMETVIREAEAILGEPS